MIDAGLGLQSAASHCLSLSSSSATGCNVFLRSGSASSNHSLLGVSLDRQHPWPPHSSYFVFLFSLFSP